MRRIAGTLAVLWLAAFAVVAEEPAAPAGEPAAVPFFLEGIDLEAPAQHAFRDWPPDSLRDRPYWLPWSWMAFRRADVLRLPVLLVLTVPWSHPAQKLVTETLADVRALRVANDGFVTIVVNADRRPDVRDRYRTGVLPAVSLLLPSGMPMLSQANPSGFALPITLGPVEPEGLVFALREGKVYFDRWEGMLAGLARAHEERTGQETPRESPVRIEASDFMARWLLGSLDAEEGGFEPAPRAVVPWLAEYAASRAARGLPALDDASRKTLLGLVQSPVHDRRDGGFHRLASLPDWKGIQYEKMLEVQARFLREASVELRRADSAPLREAARGTARFLLASLARPGGGFHNAQSADLRSATGGAWWTDDRAGREAPAIDTTPLTGPNALAGAALLRAAVVLDDPSSAEAGRGAIDLVLERGVVAGKGARHVFDAVDDDRRFLESQADVAFGLSDAYGTTGDARYLAAATDVAEFALRNLSRDGEVALRDVLAAGNEVGLLTRPRWPSEANLRLARTLIRLHHLGEGNGRFLTRAREIVGAFAGDPAAAGAAGIEAALAVEELSREPLLVVVDGAPNAPETLALRRAALASPAVWSLVRAGNAKAPARATLSREGTTETAETPEALDAAVRRLVPAAFADDRP